MTKILSRGAWLLFALLFFTPLQADQMAPGAVAVGRNVPRIRYDAATDRVSISARHSTLEDLLREISRQTELSVEAAQEGLLREPVSVELEDMPLEEALSRLLGRFNSAFLYAQGPAGAPRLSKVVIVSRKEGRPATATATLGSGAVAEKLAAEELPRVTEQTTEALLQQVKGVQGFEGKGFAEYRRAVDALRERAPERAVDGLVDVLLQNAHPPIRVHAASMLGEIADGRATDPLTWTFLNDQYPLARQTAMYSLIKIGNDSALDAVFKAFREGDSRLQQAIALAVAGIGSEMVRDRFTRMLKDAPPSVDVLSVWQLARPNTGRRP